MLLFFKKILVQILIVSSRGILVKIESISKLPMKLLESCSTVPVAKLNESLTVYLLVVSGSKIGNINFASLNAGVCQADKISLKCGNPSTHIFMHFTRAIHYTRSSSHWFQMSLCFLGYDVRVNELFINFIDAFFLTDNKIQKIVIFYNSFLKFALIT